MYFYISIFADTGFWLWGDASLTEYFNWWNSCYEANDSCVAISYNQGDGTIPDGKWTPESCNRLLPFMCTIKKGIQRHMS